MNCVFRHYALSIAITAWSFDCLAASTIDVTIMARATPGACTPTISNGGVDLGEIVKSQLNENRQSALGVHTINYSIICDAPTKLAFSLTDMRRTSVLPTAPTYAYGLGFQGRNNPIGYVTYDLKNIYGDSLPSAAMQSNDDGASWGGGSGRAASGYKYSHGSSRTPHAYTRHTGNLEARIYIAKTSSFQLAAGINVDGLAIFEIFYL